MATTLYIGLPTERLAPGVADCVRAFVASPDFAKICVGWKVRLVEYSNTASFDINGLCAATFSAPGPVLLLQPVKNADLVNFRERLNGRQIIVSTAAYDTDAVRAAVEEVKHAHDNGEPHLPTDLVVALLIMRKLDRERMWAGHNKKGCMWGEDIPKGRGVDEKFKPSVERILNMLLQAQVLVSKRSRGLNKYALNPDLRPQIMRVLENRRFYGPLHDAFNACRETISCRELDLLDEYIPANP
jgi:hypothetical protein